MTTATYKNEYDDYINQRMPHYPARFATAIVPSDTAAVAIGPGSKYAKRIYIGGAGNVTLITAGDNSNGGLGTPVLYEAVPAGTYLNVQVRQVMNTGTSATYIVGESD